MLFSAPIVEPAARVAAKAFLDFVNSTGSPYHSVLAARKLLDSAGFVRIDEINGWKSLERGGKYYVTRNHSTIMSFIIGKKFGVGKGGFVIAGSHTDSPCLRIRPNNDFSKEGYRLVSVETYGAGLWHTWFDRGLGMAGKIVVRQKNGGVEEKLVRLPRSVLIIPDLAIHLQSTEERTAFKINTEEHLRPILCSEIKRIIGGPVNEGAGTPLEPIKIILGQEVGCDPEDIVDLDISLMDATDGRLAGFYEEFVESSRIDNLASTWAAIASISEITDNIIENSSDILTTISWDNEEVGSVSYTGANGAALECWMQQVLAGLGLQDCDGFSITMAKSFLLSTDGAHGVHPNYPEKHQALHKPLFHKGVVIKENSNLKYTSHSLTMALTRYIASLATPPCPLQNIVVPNNSPCGSTIGPLCSARLGIRSVDVGISQWAMHSIRETCGVDDLFHLKNLITSLFTNFRSIDDQSKFL